MQAHMDNLENIVAERTNALKKLMQEKDAFLAVLTHDMKSPITTIHLYANIIKEHPHILEKKPHMIDAVLRSQETLIDIVNNILDLEKLQADGQVPMEKETFDYASVAQKVVEMIQAQAEAKTIALQQVGFDTRIIVQADCHHMERVLCNLLSNAIKYTPPEGTVTITLNARDDELCVQVQDSGYGIPAEELPYVFDRFHRVSSHQKLAAGTGLGLAITKAFVEAHGGHIEVTSKMEQGSTFTMHLPILQKGPPAKESGEGVKNYKDRKQKKKGVTTFISY
jgi:signal transduction histidine kinase